MGFEAQIDRREKVTGEGNNHVHNIYSRALFKLSHILHVFNENNDAEQNWIEFEASSPKTKISVWWLSSVNGNLCRWRWMDGCSDS